MMMNISVPGPNQQNGQVENINGPSKALRAVYERGLAALAVFRRVGLTCFSETTHERSLQAGCKDWSLYAVQARRMPSRKR